MRKASVLALAAVLALWFAEPAAAADPSPQPNFCAQDSAACRNLAVEIAMLDVADRIGAVVDLRRGIDVLCPEDNPNCCPPELMPFCFQTQRDLVLEARRVYQSRSVGDYDDCPWSSTICDSLGPFYCGPESSWTPWTGCLDVAFPPIDCPLGWTRLEFGGCLPPPPCPCGFVHNPKGLCIPKVCYRLGVRVPCLTLCGIDQVFVAEVEPPPPETNLERHLLDRAVHLEAAQRLRDDLRSKLEAVEKEIAELSSYR